MDWEPHSTGARFHSKWWDLQIPDTLYLPTSPNQWTTSEGQLEGFDLALKWSDSAFLCNLSLWLLDRAPCRDLSWDELCPTALLAARSSILSSYHLAQVQPLPTSCPLPGPPGKTLLPDLYCSFPTLHYTAWYRPLNLFIRAQIYNIQPSLPAWHQVFAAEWMRGAACH